MPWTAVIYVLAHVILLFCFISLTNGCCIKKKRKDTTKSFGRKTQGTAPKTAAPAKPTSAPPPDPNEYAIQKTQEDSLEKTDDKKDKLAKSAKKTNEKKEKESNPDDKKSLIEEIPPTVLSARCEKRGNLNDVFEKQQAEVIKEIEEMSSTHAFDKKKGKAASETKEKEVVKINEKKCIIYLTNNDDPPVAPRDDKSSGV